MQYLFRWLVQYLVFMGLSIVSSALTCGLFVIGCYLFHLSGLQADHLAWLGFKLLGTLVFILSFFILRECTLGLNSVLSLLYAWVEQAKR